MMELEQLTKLNRLFQLTICYYKQIFIIIVNVIELIIYLQRIYALIRIT